MRRELGDHASYMSGLACPLRGCRAPELASGAISQQLQKACDQAFVTLACKWRSQLSANMFAGLLSDLDQGKRHIGYVLTLKLAHWRELPWLISILSHHKRDIAQKGAACILKKFEEASHHGEARHTISKKFCAPGSLLSAQLAEFADGTCAAQQLSSPISEILCLAPSHNVRRAS